MSLVFNYCDVSEYVSEPVFRLTIHFSDVWRGFLSPAARYSIQLPGGASQVSRTFERIVKEGYIYRTIQVSSDLLWNLCMWSLFMSAI